MSCIFGRPNAHGAHLERALERSGDLPARRGFAPEAKVAHSDSCTFGVGCHPEGGPEVARSILTARAPRARAFKTSLPADPAVEEDFDLVSDGPGEGGHTRFDLRLTAGARCRTLRDAERAQRCDAVARTPQSHTTAITAA